MPTADAPTPSGTSQVVACRSAQRPNSGCAIDDVTVATSTTAPVFAYDRCRTGLRKTSTAGRAPAARSAARCASQRSTITRRSRSARIVRAYRRGAPLVQRHQHGVERPAVALLHARDEVLRAGGVEREADRKLSCRLPGAADVRQLLRVAAVRVDRPVVERAVPRADAARED